MYFWFNFVHNKQKLLVSLFIPLFSQAFRVFFPFSDIIVHKWFIIDQMNFVFIVRIIHI